MGKKSRRQRADLRKQAPAAAERSLVAPISVAPASGTVASVASEASEASEPAPELIRHASGIRLCAEPSGPAVLVLERLVSSTDVAPPAGPREAVAAPASLAEQRPPEEHRGSPRVSLTVDIHLSSHSHFFSDLSGDISEGGLFLSTYQLLPIGSAVELEFSLPGTDRTLHARGEVRWLREHSTFAPRGVGIAFSDLSPDDRDRIHDFCSVRPPLYYEDLG